MGQHLSRGIGHSSGMRWRGWWMTWQRAAVRLVARVAAAAGSMFAISGVATASADIGRPVRPDYPALTSMSAMARFPAIRACALARARDLAGLRLQAVRRTRRSRRKKKRDIVDDDILDLLELQPNAGCDAYLFRQQLIVDRGLTGNAYILRRDPGDASIYRLHPNLVEPLVGPMGLPVGYRYHGGSEVEVFTPQQVIHVREVSWQDNVTSALGEGAIRALHDDLVADLASRSMAAELAGRGTPQAILSGKDRALGPDQVDEIHEQIHKAEVERRSAVVIGEGVDVTTLSLTPEQLQLAEQGDRLLSVILMTFEVPPARAGLVTANYGTQKQQMRTYWESLMREAVAWNLAFSRLASPGVLIEHDFTSVEALQLSYTERLMRVTTWVGMGASPAGAAEYEGFDEAPVPDAPLVDEFHSPRRPAREPDEPQKSGDVVRFSASDSWSPPTAAQLTARLSAYFLEARPRWTEAAEAIRAGADVALVVRWETERCWSVLDAAGLPPELARWWAERIVQATADAVELAAAEVPVDAAVDLTELRALSLQRAHDMGRRIEAALQTAEAA